MVDERAREFRGFELARLVAGCGSCDPTWRWIEHPYGATKVPGRPRRVVSLGLDEHELLLHLGIVPLLVRDEWGDQPNAVWPWARHLLGGARPATFTGDALPLDRIRALAPDLIVATWDAVDEARYRELAAIAPTLPNSSNPTDPWPQLWDEHFLELATALGRRPTAQTMVDGVRTRVMAIAEGHPHWQDLVAASLTIPEELLDIDICHQRGALLAALGFRLPTDLAQFDDDRCAQVLPGDIRLVDRDLVLWVNGTDDPDPIVRYPGRTTLVAHREGREVYLDKLYTAAFSVQTPSSLHFLLDALVPEIEAAVDGRPDPPVSLAARYGIAPEA